MGREEEGKKQQGMRRDNRREIWKGSEEEPGEE